jgi:hypothetical protein
MSGWPSITEPELLDRLGLDERGFEEYLRNLAAVLSPRDYEAALFERAIGYPWTRPLGSYRLTDTGVEPLEEMTAAERERVLAEFLSEAGGRLPVLAIGSNGAPEALERKFAHFPAERDRSVLALTGRLHDFDVGAAAQPSIYGAMPATLFPSPGTTVRATVLWVTPAQFTQLTWSELTYRLGRLKTRFEVEEGDEHFAEVLVFVSRFGAFCIDGRPVALAAIEATGRTAEALTQQQVLDAAAALAIGPEARAETLVRAIFEDLDEANQKIAATVHKASLPFDSELWTPFDPAAATPPPLP